ncbi:pilus assembly protein PilB [Pyxidicoccus parkwayensis]|uniref:Pilus assembly protein PilB n=1 Tax=Pyxidicoccus parkwayensis TaxID=2813578 RepID=A0ABX7PDL3_9BACT|nr:pilus assembly protein PilB [Pyxidicoccus parkwaysis]QSQ28594.1 pilus assembly protein PilB [Pyxidicoccus parkwaysis]
MRLGETLLHLGWVSPEQLETALAYHSQWHCRLGEAFVYLRVLTPEQVQRALSSQLKVPFVRGEQMAKVPAAVVHSVPADMLRRWRVCPLRVERQGSRGILYVATDQPGNLPALDELAFVTNFTVRPVLALPEDIEQTLRRHGLAGTRGVVSLELEPDDGRGLDITRGSEALPASDTRSG